MKVFRGCPNPLLRLPTALAIGNFDGVHLGHQALLQQVVQAANARGLVPSVMTFEPHPREVLGPGSEHTRLSTLYDKVLRILETGIQRIYVMPFHKSLSGLSPEAFARTVLVDGLDTHWVTVGENFRFGDKGAGRVSDLERLGRELNFETYIAPLLTHDGERVSSTRVRRALAENDFYEARLMLGRNYSMTGRVIHGRALGRKLGFPTLNIAPIPVWSDARPAVSGVFAVRVKGLSPTIVYNGVASLGVKPTICSDRRYLLETNVFDWTGDAYGRVVEIEFIERLRSEKKFSGIDELKAAINADALNARRLLGSPLETITP